MTPPPLPQYQATSSDYSASQYTLTPTLRLSNIDISLGEDSHKTIESIELRKNDELMKDVPSPTCQGRIHRIEFDPPPALNPDDRISVLVSCSWQLGSWKRVGDIPVDINLRDDEHTRHNKEENVTLYRKKARNIEVVIACQSLLATTTVIFQSCPKFRLLIIGNSGVGKSSLIHKVFGVESVHPSETSRGEADINTEFVSPKNNRIVVHDSLGFEAGDEENIDIVKNFISKRKAMPRQDRLHAVWLCFEIPYSGGRLLDAGAEKFLERRNEILGDVPLVVVLTKMDLLDEQSWLDCPSNESVEDYKSGCMDKYCMGPLHKAAGSDVTHVTVSTLDGYSGSLSRLFEATQENMAKNHVDEAPRIVASIAQRISVKDKLEASIAIGKKKYWRTLLKSAVFCGHTLKECLEVIHKDVIAVWNFDDPDTCLLDDTIIGALLRTDNLPAAPDTSSNMASFGTLLASGVEAVKTVSQSGEPISAIAVHIAEFAFYLVQTMYTGYQEAKKDVKILMGYTVDLVCIMQAIFLLAPGGRVTAETVTLALGAYQKPRKIVHQLVDAFDGKLGVLPGGRDHVLDKIEEWAWRFSIADHEIEGLKQRIGQALSSGSS